MPGMDMHTLWRAIDPVFLAFIIFLAALWALMEIQIEGPHGWAKNLPTWRVEKHFLLDLLLGGSELTGYHLYAFLSTFLFFHLALAGGWTWRGELRVLGGYALFWLLEDYLWFVFNPHYGARGLTPDRVPWHRRWFLGWPGNYWIIGGLGLFLYFLPAAI